MISEKPLFFANAKFKLYLERYSTGKYGWCGGIPEELCELKKNHIGQEYMGTKIYDTLEDALKDAEKYNITDFKVI